MFGLKERYNTRKEQMSARDSRIAENFDVNELASMEGVMHVADATKLARSKTGRRFGGEESPEQVVPLTHSFPSDQLEGIVIQGRGIMAGFSDAAYDASVHPVEDSIDTTLPNPGAPLPKNPFAFGKDAMFASSIAAGVNEHLHGTGSEPEFGYIIPGLPGVAADPFELNNDHVRDALTPEQKTALLRGDNELVAQAEAQAIYNLLEQEDRLETPLHIVLASQSTSQTAMAMKLIELGANVQTLSLLEPVATGNQPMFSMLPQFLRSSRLFKRFMDLNHNAYKRADEMVGAGESVGLRAQPKFLGSSALYALALRNESLEPLFDEKNVAMARERGVKLNIRLTTGEYSEFSGIQDRAEEAADKARSAGWGDVETEIVEDGAHALTVNPTSFIHSLTKSIASSIASKKRTDENQKSLSVLQ